MRPSSSTGTSCGGTTCSLPTPAFTRSAGDGPGRASPTSASTTSGGRISASWATMCGGSRGSWPRECRYTAWGCSPTPTGCRGGPQRRSTRGRSALSTWTTSPCGQGASWTTRWRWARSGQRRGGGRARPPQCGGQGPPGRVPHRRRGGPRRLGPRRSPRRSTSGSGRTSSGPAADLRVALPQGDVDTYLLVNEGRRSRGHGRRGAARSSGGMPGWRDQPWPARRREHLHTRVRLERRESVVRQSTPPEAHRPMSPFSLPRRRDRRHRGPGGKDTEGVRWIARPADWAQAPG